MEANHSIYSKGQQSEECSDMGTTITAAIVRDMELYTAHIGDSSLFLINSDGVEKITRDHTPAEKMLQEGLIDENDIGVRRYRHILTRALGLKNRWRLTVIPTDLNLKTACLWPLTGDGSNRALWKFGEAVIHESDLNRACIDCSACFGPRRL